MPQLASDNFNRANENPLNAANWTTITGSQALQVVSNACESAGATSQVARELFTNATWPNDQYSQCTIISAAVGSILTIYARASTTTGANNYQFLWTVPAGGLGASGTWKIQHGGTQLSTGSIVLSANDVIAISCVGTTISAFKNGVLINAVTDATFASGTPGLGMTPLVAIASNNLDTWSGGSVVTTANPTASPNGGSFGPAQTVTLNDATANSTIYYTTDGSTPTIPPTGTTQSVAAGGTITISATSTLKMIALSNGTFDSASSVVSVSFTINGATGTPTFNPAAGTYGSTQNVTITSANSTTITYTTDGTTPIPGSHGTVYSGPVAVASSLTIKAIGSAVNWSNSAEGDAAYVISGFGLLNLLGVN